MLRIAVLLAFVLQAQPPRFPDPVIPGAADLDRVRAKTGELERLLDGVSGAAAHKDDAAVYAKAGRMLLEFPETFFTAEGVTQALAVLDQGIARARDLAAGRAPWVNARGRKIHAYRSALDGSLQPYGVTVPESYDGSQPVRLYVWLHGRDRTLTEASFLYKFPNPNKSPTYATADAGQITLDCYGRWNNANHWAGEVDVFEAIEAVKQRYKIDPNRIVLRGFSLGGAGAWHIALQHPDRFAAAEIGAGTYPRRASMPGFPPYQAGPLRIWENIIDWSLNAFNIPIAGHDGDSDPQVAVIPPDPSNPGRGQLESSLRVRAQLAKEGFPSSGEENNWRVPGTPTAFYISEKTGHSISPLVRQRIDVFLKEHGDRGVISRDRVKFVTYTTRYGKAHWMSIDGMAKLYDRADVDASRDSARRIYTITSNNVTHLILREADQAQSITVDGEMVRFRKASEIHLEKTSRGWRQQLTKGPELRKSQGMQGPIDDAFLEPFLLVEPTGVPWNSAANEQAKRILARFDRVYARYYRAHPRIKKDSEVTIDDFARYHVALFGDPGSNRWIARMAGKLPVRWSRESLQLGDRKFNAASHLPALVYPNPLRPGRYVVLNSGLTLDEKEYHSDYSMPRLGDFAVLPVKPGQDLPDPVFAGLFDERWR